MSQAPSTPAAAGAPPRSSPDLTWAVYLAYVVFSLVWFRVYFTSQPIAAVDLPGHLMGVEGLRRHLWTLGYTFYDVSCFTGYPAFQFYSFLIHWFTAILAIPLSLVADDSARLSAHIMLVFGMVSLPLPWFYAVKPLAAEVFGEDAEKLRKAGPLLMMASATFAFWFINHDYQWWGIGAAAVMNIGLFSQAFGWHFMLFHAGAVFRLIKDGKESNVRLVAVFFTLLMLTHTMTAVFAFYLAFMAFLWFHNRRRQLLKAHIMATLLMGFWLIPMAAELSSYTIKDIHRPQGDFFEIMLRYPFFSILRSMRSFLAGKFELIGFAEPLMVILMTVLVAHRNAHKARLLITFTAFLLAGMAILQSGFIASSVPLGFHYYRFVAYMMIFAATLLSAVPAYLVESAHNPAAPRWAWPATQVGLGGAFFVAFLTTTLLPHNEREKVANTANKEYLKSEYQVLEYFKNLPDKGRVVFEYFSDYNKYPFLSCHFMTTRLWKDTGFEPINGLFVQSSLPYHFPMGAANQLKANTYNGPLLYPASTDLTDEHKIQQLRDFGVTHLVIGGDEFLTRVKPFALGEPVVIGHYKIVQIMDKPPPTVTPVTKHLVAYVDLRGNVPYKFMELYFWGKAGIYPTHEIMSVKPGDELPPQVEILLINGDPAKVASVAADMKARLVASGAAEPKVVALDYQYHYLTKHYGTWYQHNPEIDDYAEFAKYVDKEKLSVQLAVPERPASSVAPGTFAWEPGNQRFTAGGLTPGQLYRVSYSYFPYWHASGATLFRMGNDRIMVWAKAATVEAYYTRMLSLHTYVGWGMTLLGLWWVRRSRRAHPA